MLGRTRSPRRAQQIQKDLFSADVKAIKVEQQRLVETQVERVIESEGNLLPPFIQLATYTNGIPVMMQTSNGAGWINPVGLSHPNVFATQQGTMNNSEWMQFPPPTLPASFSITNNSNWDMIDFFDPLRGSRNQMQLEPHRAMLREETRPGWGSKQFIQRPEQQADPIILANGLIMKPLPRPANKPTEPKRTSIAEGIREMTSPQLTDQLTKALSDFSLNSPHPQSGITSILGTPGLGLYSLLSPQINAAPQSIHYPSGSMTPMPSRALENFLDEQKLRILENEELVGAYTKEQRKEKISRYKYKIKKYRDLHPINRHFAGRSRVAVTKPRLMGKFIKSSKDSTSQKSNNVRDASTSQSLNS
eukprot:TRINITY_DN2031_c0_g1_i6.p1 TRINITY_DN2031_c0_g1~~TRINITY_DN2031_c0_g1_i6.p1  ORF type:complete len:362 (+),score=63.85 TRINITY_DN2031_c0_g1_i6:134-1219(+)